MKKMLTFVIMRAKISNIEIGDNEVVVLLHHDLF